MYRAKQIITDDKPLFYKTLLHLLNNLVEDEHDWLANLANASALLGHQIADINWVGFYLHKDNELVLGPFQGKPACTHIEIGKGVCGTAAATKTTQLVPDVAKFPGHIACDAASRSEIVVPILTADGQLLAVLDVDSPLLERFDEQDVIGLEQVAKRLAALPGWPI